MEKRARMLVKILITIVLVFILIWLIYSDERVLQPEQPEGELVRRKDVEILVNELWSATGKQTENDLWNQMPDETPETDETDEYFSYRSYLKLLDVLLPEKTSESNDRIRDRLTYKNKYRDTFLLLKEDWYDSFDLMIKEWGLGDIIRKEKVEILCGNQNLTGEEKLGEGCILDRNGRVYRCLSEDAAGLTFSCAEVYVREERILTLFRVLPDQIHLTNVWIMEAWEDEIQFFYRGYEILAEKTQAGQEIGQMREQIGDFSFQEGSISDVSVKNERIGGKLLGISEEELEIEGYGKVPIQEECVGYQLYETLRNADRNELLVGYDFADFVLEKGEICAFLLARKESMETIRVAVKTNHFASLYHDRITLLSQDDMTLTYGSYGERKTEEIAGGETFTIEPGDKWFSGERVEVETVTNTGKIQVSSLERSQGIPAYRGKMEIVETEEGLVLINEVPLEEYLYSVVPSEMPAKYPIEALKAQAVSARTYGYRYLLQPGYQSLGAHVDDSVGYQVYNNIEENVNSTRAVKDTTGMLLLYEEEPVSTYYYSTSCGFGADAGIWNEDKKEELPYINSVYIAKEADAAAGKADAEEKLSEEPAGYSPQDLSDEEKFRNYIYGVDENAYEREEAWFRWHYYVEEIDAELMFQKLKNRYEAGQTKVLTFTGSGDAAEAEEEDFASEEPVKFDAVREIQSLRRRDGGVMDELLIVTDRNTYKIKSEYNIRYILNQGGEVIRQDGSSNEGMSLLPSAYLAIDTLKEEENVIGYTIVGGGYGHGAGMSQNGARAMGMEGKGYEEILSFFFRDCRIEKIY